MDLRIAVPAAAAWLGAILLTAAPGYAPAAAGIAWIVCVLLLVIAVRWHRPLVMGGAVAVGITALVMVSVAVHAPQRHPEILTRVADAGTSISAVVITTSPVGDGPLAATLVSVEVGAGGGTASPAGVRRYSSLRVPVLIFDAAPAGARIGTTLRVEGTLLPNDPQDDVSYLLFADTAAVPLSEPGAYLRVANSLRAGFAATATDLPGDGGRLLPGLAIGDTAAVSESLDLAMKTSSLSHLTAVSGANCAIIIALILLAGGAVGLPRIIRVGASLLVLAGFVVLVTPEPSVLRAAVMATLVLAAFSAGRPVRGIPVLAVAVITLLVIDPWLGRNYGFVLSVLATGGLLVLAGPLARLLARWLPLWLAAVIAVPLAAQLACQPVLLLLDPSIPVFGILANLLAAPAAPLATVVGLVSCLLLPLIPPAGTLLAVIAWLPAAWIGAVARFFAGLPLARAPWPGTAVGIGALTIVTVSILVVVLLPLPRVWRHRLVFTAAACVVVVMGVGAGHSIASRLNRPGDWQIAACDIGQGDAMVVRSAGQVALMDTGPDPAALADCLDTLRIDRIDLLVLSHFDLDHVGGTPAVIGRVDRVLVGPSAEPADDALVRDLVAGGAEVHRVSRGPTGVLGELTWRVLWPPLRLGEIEPGNDASVTVRFDPGRHCATVCLSSLFLGDLGERSQNRVISLNHGLSTVDVIEVGHHGSADQSPALYKAASATVGLIGVGLDNGYGHPTDRLLQILADSGTAVGRTDLDGLVLVAPGEEAGSLTLWRERSGVAGDG